MINRLRGLRVYLIGAIDREPDAGAGWREASTPFLESRGCIVFNPLKKPIEVGLEDDDNRADRRLWKENGEYDKVRECMKVVRRTDMRMVDICDFLICNLDIETHPCGTYREMFLANDERKPVIVRCEQGKSAVPDWLYGELPHEMFFSAWDEVYAYLRHVDNAEWIDSYKRWMFFDIHHRTREALSI